MSILMRLASFGAESFAPASEGTGAGAKDPAEVMKDVRLMFIGIKAGEVGMAPCAEFPRAWGVAMDWPLPSGHTATVVADKEGHASLYTTSTFGILGGIGHEPVRAAAQTFVRIAERFVDQAAPVSEFPYPPGDRAYFYIRTYEGVRRVEALPADIANAALGLGAFFNAGQNVLTELRQGVEQQVRERKG